MSDFHTLQAFIDSAKQANSASELGREFGSAVATMGVDHFLCVTFEPFEERSSHAIAIAQTPKVWAHRYGSQNYREHDRIIEVSLREVVPFKWSEPAVTDGITGMQQRILDEASEAGIVDGFTVPIHSRGIYPGCVSLMGDLSDISPQTFHAMHLMAIYLHEAALRLHKRGRSDPGPEERLLTDRERECLRWASMGKTDWEIGRVLNISENTAHFHIENIKRKLGVSTRVQAVVRAFLENQILP